MNTIERLPQAGNINLRNGALFGILALMVYQCNPQQGVQNPVPNVPATVPSVIRLERPERSNEPIAEGETCTNTEDCPRGARCFDGRCMPARRSLQGEVQAERGHRALANNRYPEAEAAFRDAIAAYESQGFMVPSSISCGFARALSGLNDRGGVQRNARENVARALIRCLATAPRGSSLADQALASLTSLSDRGLNVAALDQPDAALMTGQDPRPTPDTAQVQLTFTGATGEGARAAFRDAAVTEPVKREVTRCFMQWWEPGRQETDQGALRIVYSRAVNHDYEELGPPRLTVTASLDTTPSVIDAGTSAQHWLTCSASAVQSAVQSVRWPAREERWAESLNISVTMR